MEDKNIEELELENLKLKKKIKKLESELKKKEKRIREYQDEKKEVNSILREQEALIEKFEMDLDDAWGQIGTLNMLLDV